MLNTAIASQLDKDDFWTVPYLLEHNSAPRGANTVHPYVVVVKALASRGLAVQPKCKGRREMGYHRVAVQDGVTGNAAGERWIAYDERRCVVLREQPTSPYVPSENGQRGKMPNVF